MAMISTIDSINISNISSILTTNYEGVEMTYNPNNPFHAVDMRNSFLTYSTLITYDLSGESNVYMIDISGAQNLLNTMTPYKIEEASTLAGISTMQGLSTIAAIEIDFNDIINSHNILLEIEKENKRTLNTLDFSVFKTNLYKWGSLNYPDSFQAYSFPVTTPSMSSGLYLCSDGNPKNIWDYIPFCLNMSIAEWLSAYQAKVNGITLSFSVNENPYIINIHVTRSKI